MEPFNARVNQVLAGVGVDRNDRHLFHEHGLCFGEQCVALFPRRSLGRLVQDQVIIDRVAVVGVVVAPVGDE